MIEFFMTQGVSIVEVPEITAGCWVNAVKPTGSEIEFLANELNVPLDFFKAALDEEESSHIETEDGNSLIIVDIPVAETEDNNIQYTTMPVGIIMSEKAIVTVTLKETLIINEFKDGLVKNVNTKMKTQFLLNLLLRIATRFLIHLKQIDKISNHFERLLHKSMKNKELIQLLGLDRKSVV